MPKAHKPDFGVGRSVPVQVTTPIEVIYDIDRFQKAQRAVLSELGCPQCTSGFDVDWKLQTDFFFDADGLIAR